MALSRSTQHRPFAEAVLSMHCGPERKIPCRCRLLGVSLALFGVIACTSLPLGAAEPPGAANAPSDGATLSIETIAVGGTPFGIARVRYPIEPFLADESLPPVEVTGAAHTVLYPVSQYETVTTRSGPPLVEIPPGRRFGQGRLLGRITNIVRAATSEEVRRNVAIETLFLFRGDQPLQVKVGAAGHMVTLIPRVTGTASLHTDLRQRWWQAYTQRARTVLGNPDYPPQAEHYLISMLARRMGLTIPESLRAAPESDDPSMESTLRWLAGTEEMRTRFFQRVAQEQQERPSPLEFPLPQAPQWQAVQLPADAPQAEIVEEIARQVPVDSLYLRFGSFSNYMWFSELTKQYGGDLAQMLTLRGLDYGTSARNERLLQMYTSGLAKLLGPALIDDMAIIGSDLFLTDGPSIGVLIKARNAFLVSAGIQRERQQAAKTIPGASLEERTIASRPISLLSTPDHQVRSFFVEQGNYLLVTSSETLVRKFLETAQGGPSLADSPGFRYARAALPLTNDYSLFAYFSDKFFQNLVGPQYQIELRRRLDTVSSLTLLQIAQLAARGEGLEIQEIGDLVDAGFLPRGFGQRSDGGQIVGDDHPFACSIRGRRGSMFPIADAPVDRVTAEENLWYQARAAFYSEKWQQMDPIVIAINRKPAADGINEKLEIHAEIAPLVPEKYGWIAKQLGPPTTTHVQMPRDDIAWGQAYVASDPLDRLLPPHILFVGLKDSLLPKPAELDGLLETFFALRSLSGYLGAWPQPGLLDRLPWGIGQGQPVGPGMSRLLVGLYRYQGDGYSILSFIPEIITASLPQLKIAEDPFPAQVRLRVQDLRGSQLQTWVNEQLYERSYRASLANLELLGALTTQLGVAPSAAVAEAAQVLDAQLQCPLGGTYVFESPNEATRIPSWTSTAIDPSGRQSAIPDDYLATLLQWFRGFQGRLTQYDNRLVADVELEMEPAVPAKKEPRIDR